jgi:ATP-dependent DNA helicase Rep
MQAALPSRFIAEMKLDEARQVENPRARLLALRAAAVARAEAARQAVAPTRADP